MAALTDMLVVSLEVADEMPARSEVGERCGLVPYLLRAAFGELTTPTLDKHAGQVRPDVFRDADQRHLANAASRPLADSCDPGLKRSEVFTATAPQLVG